MTSSADAQEMAESGVAAQALLFEPLTLHDLTIKNRTWLSLMCQHMVTVEDALASGASRRTSAGRVRADHDRVSRGGSRGADHAAGHGHVERQQQAVWTGSSSSATARVPRWRSSWPTLEAMPRCIAASPPSQKARSSPLTRAGRRWDRRLSPTPVRPVPHALTIEEIGGVVQAFVDAARRSDRAGSTSLRFTPPMAICCTSSSRRCRIRPPTGTGVISPGGPGYQVPFARSVPGAESRPPRWGCWLGRVRLRRSCAAATRRGLRRPGGAAGAVLAAASRAQVGHEMARSGLPADIHTRGAWDYAPALD